MRLDAQIVIVASATGPSSSSTTRNRANHCGTTAADAARGASVVDAIGAGGGTASRVASGASTGVRSTEDATGCTASPRSAATTDTGSWSFQIEGTQSA